LPNLPRRWDSSVTQRCEQRVVKSGKDDVLVAIHMHLPSKDPNSSGTRTLISPAPSVDEESGLGRVSRDQLDESGNCVFLSRSFHCSQEAKCVQMDRVKDFDRSRRCIGIREVNFGLMY